MNYYFNIITDSESGGSTKGHRSLTATLGLVVHAAGMSQFAGIYSPQCIKNILPLIMCFKIGEDIVPYGFDWWLGNSLSPNSVADGIALGAAAASSHTDVEMIVFFAIMLHKVTYHSHFPHILSSVAQSNWL